jgi:DNA-binding MarR family transcriptional regulator
VELSEPSDRTALGSLQTALSALSYAMSGNQTHTRLRREAGVTIDRASLAVLRVLSASPSPLLLRELAEALMVKAPHVTREVRRLEELGLVETTREPGDQRARRVAPTEDGREAVARTEATGRQWLAEALSDFSASDVCTTAAVIDRIVDAYRQP